MDFRTRLQEYVTAGRNALMSRFQSSPVETPGDVAAETQAIVTDHSHAWKRGTLPGQRYVRTCECGSVEEINREAWEMLS